MLWLACCGSACTLTEHLLLFSTALPAKCQYQGVDVVTSRRASLRRRAGSPRHATDASTFGKPLSIMDVLLERRLPQRSHRRCSLSLSSGRAGGRARFHRRLRLYLTPFPRASFSGHSQSFRERPRRLAFYRARSARTALDRRRQRVQQLRVRGDRATKARDGRPGAARTIDEHDLGEPAARRQNRAKTRTHDDAKSHAGPVVGAAQRLGLGNVRSPLQN